MQSLPNGKMPQPSSKARRGVSQKMATFGMTLMLLVFLVAVVFAANENDVVGWLVVIISLGWLCLFAFVVFSVRGAARKAGAKLAEAQDSLTRAAGGAPAVQVVDEATTIRDQKLDHSFKIVQVQSRVIRENLGKDEDQVSRALETIEITSHNARSMIKKDDGGPVEGTLVD
ncbi:hypothetical protein QNO08_04060 [Arthrobacter sp. zg-Y820]|uniref:hypothetical protein n=1 Tax=unclassified Arthrobacter TaxID=235627 RepID=UPI001E3C9DDC|nr:MULTISPECIES: hypothetical protein [unclassified Arthrobacter]MCC9195511.1 hypothetical protein [Arthrobacter sp. zg-Y820]MDK1278370.1 hypothetical protein [Arthrobacter sp. zg.Y820]WIB10245.1 hypothetical protein QNO08_04060 [Arthrobacter sp. zg-Y820]